MSLRSIHLRKLLKILFSPINRQTAAIRSDIRDDIARESGENGGGGGDFYAPFWSDAKAHAIGALDLHQSTDERMAANGGRENLYPQLRDGFLVWWNQRRRFTNAPFTAGNTQKARFGFPGIDATVKVEGVLSLRDGNGVEHYIYPYFSPGPVMSEEAARLGLWLLISALPGVPPEEIRILDVIRGETYSVDRYPLQGNEEERFRSLYVDAINRWEELRKEYM